MLLMLSFKRRSPLKIASIFKNGSEKTVHQVKSQPDLKPDELTALALFLMRIAGCDTDATFIFMSERIPVFLALHLQPAFFETSSFNKTLDNPPKIRLLNFSPLVPYTLCKS